MGWGQCSTASITSSWPGTRSICATAIGLRLKHRARVLEVNRTLFGVLDELELAVDRQRLYGVYPATVTDIKDPDSQGRVKIKLTWSPDNGGRGYDVLSGLDEIITGSNRGS